MTDQFILTPFYIDKSLSGLGDYAQPGWWANEGHLPGSSPQERMVQLYRPLKDLVAQAIDDGLRPVSIAGDCCTTIGVLAGLQMANVNPTLIWLDAHGDFNTWETTPSGFLGGMPLAMLVGRGEQTIVQGVGLEPLHERRVVLCDGRDLDPAEKAALEDSSINWCPNLGDVSALLPLEGPVYVHLDTDFINPIDAPAMNYPSPGGPRAAEVHSFLETLAKTGQIAAVSVSAWNPDLDDSRLTGGLVMDLLNGLQAAG